MRPNEIPEPWKAFLSAVDERLSERLDLHCFGGFVVTVLYGLTRFTADVDVVSSVPGKASGLLALAGKGSALHRQHGFYLDFVTIASVPEDYDQRLTEMFPGAFRHLRLFALDPYDIALAKLERNVQHDRDDVRHLARTVPFDLDILKERYEKELRPLLGNPTREDLTLRLWLEAFTEDRSQ